jgi:uncharacterized protein
LTKTNVTDESEHGQATVVAFLSGADAYGGADAPEIIETHVSRIFLSGERAYKLKRAVRYPYLDFSTLERRKAACEEEVAINRRTAPDTYLGVIAVRQQSDGNLLLDTSDCGDGRVVEWLVAMRRFDQAGLFDRLAQAGGLRRRLMESLADAIAAFHDKGEPCDARGGAAGSRLIIENNAESFLLAPDGMFDPEEVAAFHDCARALVDRLADGLDARRAAGAVRRCHGDLHLRNICLIDDRPTLFDGIEFSRDFSEIDVLYDLAFLMMDLDFRGLRRLASIIFNRYFDITGEGLARPAALSVLPLFLSMRAAVRAHVDATQAASLSDEAKRRQRGDEARAYLQLALGYLHKSSPRLVAVGGLSGSGKSRMSRELAPFIGGAPGARVVRTDVVRKRLWGVAPEVRLPDEAYSGDMHQRTYEAFYAEIQEALSQGHDVIADGVFSSPVQRDRVRDMAAEMGVSFLGIWMTAPAEVMEKRVVERQHNASDATLEVLRQQLNYDLGEIDWTCIDSSAEKQATLEAGKALLHGSK